MGLIEGGKRFIYNYKSRGVIKSATSPLTPEEMFHFRNRGFGAVRGTVRQTFDDMRDAVTTPYTGQNGWVAAFGPMAVDGIGHFADLVIPGSSYVPRAVGVVAAQALRTKLGYDQVKAYRADDPTKINVELADFKKQQLQDDLMRSGEFRLSLYLYEREQNGHKDALARIIPLEMLEFARAKLKETYDFLDQRLQEYHSRTLRGRREHAHLGDKGHSVLDTRAVRHQDLVAAEQMYKDFFAGKEKATGDEEEGRPMHDAIVANLQRSENRDLRLHALRGSATATSNFLIQETATVNHRIRSNRIVRNANVVQVLATLGLAAVGPGGFLETAPLMLTAGAALAGAAGIPLLAGAVPAVVLSALVVGTGLAFFSGVNRFLNKNKLIKSAKQERRALRTEAENTVRRFKNVYDTQGASLQV